MADTYAESIRQALRSLDATVEDLSRATGIPADPLEHYVGGVEVPAMVEQRAISTALLDLDLIHGRDRPTVFINDPEGGPFQLDAEVVTQVKESDLVLVRGCIKGGGAKEYLLPPGLPYYIRGTDLFERVGPQ